MVQCTVFRKPGSSRRRALYWQCHHDQAKPDRRKPGHVRQRHTGLWRPALENTTIHFNGFDAFDGGRCALAVSGPGTAVVNFCTITDNLTFDTIQSSGLCTMVDTVNTASLTLRKVRFLQEDKLVGSTDVLPGSRFYGQRNLQPRRRQHLRLFPGHQPGSTLIPAGAAPEQRLGLTQTRALLDGSPAIDYVRVDTGVTVDQRGCKRPVGPWADIGAEYEPRSVSRSAHRTGKPPSSVSEAGTYQEWRAGPPEGLHRSPAPPVRSARSMRGWICSKQFRPFQVGTGPVVGNARHCSGRAVCTVQRLHSRSLASRMHEPSARVLKVLRSSR